MRVLHLTLTKEWFDLIRSGGKKIEYRMVKKYWIDRLCNNGNYIDPKDFDIIHFVNGYGNLRPWFEIEYKSMFITRHDAEGHVDLKGEKHFAIRLGNKLAEGNIEVNQVEIEG